MSDVVRAENIACEVDHAARQLAQAGRLDLTREFIQHGDVTVYAHVTSVARASLSFAECLGRAGISVDVLRCCAEPCCTITFSMTGTIPIQAIGCMAFATRFLPWRVPRKILN